MTRLELLRELQTRLEAAGKPAVEARWVLAHLVGADNEGFATRLFEPVAPDVAQAALAMAELRAKGHPLQLLLGSAEFFGLKLEVRPGVLIPRPETEGLVERALECLTGIAEPEVVDVGTGTGAIALALKSIQPEATVWATDPDPKAVALAGDNARRLGLEIHLLEAPFTAHLNDLDLVVSNPPYLPDGYRDEAPDELLYEDDSALYSGPEGLDMPRELLRHAWEALKPGGWVALELSPHNVYALLEEASVQGWHKTHVHRDLAQQPRYLLGQKPKEGVIADPDEAILAEE